VADSEHWWLSLASETVTNEAVERHVPGVRPQAANHRHYCSEWPPSATNVSIQNTPYLFNYPENKVNTQKSSNLDIRKDNYEEKQHFFFFPSGKSFMDEPNEGGTIFG
jgi:hypothetical protein